jgi:mRNA-degrading endonuclease RelE of RelBE toxin-antitoxin system
LHLEIERQVLQYINSLPAKDRRIIKSHLVQLEDPLTARDVEYLRDGVCRMHISHTYTGFFVVFRDRVRVVDVLTIDQAHKKYRRF